MPLNFNHVIGNNKGKVVLYALSTCLWCKKTKRLLNKLGVDYYYIDVDLLPEQEKQEVRKQVIYWKKKVAYPCIIIDDKKCIPNFDEDKIKRELA